MGTIAGRGVLISAAAFALIGGGAGAAFAGEAPADGHSEHQGDEKAAHAGQDKHDKGEAKKDDAKCVIPYVDPTAEQAEGAVNSSTQDATKPVFDSGNEAIAPAHDAICPPAKDLLGQFGQQES